ncbi:MAG: polysaccharide biosynthesis C-terminal domain-containing protein [Lachnospiraceae bacterium]|nr:polysaccharide biosynthesis C-terminal domain-containing protein [Lachnospiraceae bacterium]
MNQAMITKKQLMSISYILGGCFFLYFAGKIGNNGIGYMAMVIELLCLFVFLVSEEITDFVSKMIRGKKTKGLHKDAYNVRRRVLVIQFITGIILSVVLFALADVLAEGIFKVPYIGICLRIVAPVIFLKSMETVYLGSFQSSGAQMPTVVCAFLRQILFFVFGFLFTEKIMSYGEKVAGLLQNEDFAGMYGAIGLCTAITLAELLVFLFQFFLYLISDRKKEKKRIKDGLQTTEDLRTTLYYYYSKVVLIFFSQVFYRLPIVMGILFSLRALSDPFGSAYQVGRFYGPFLVLCFIPVILVEIGTYVMQGKLTYYSNKSDHRGVRETIAAGLHYCVIFTVFLSVIFLTLSGQITAVLVGLENGEFAQYIKLGSVFVIVMILANFGMGLLRSMNQKRYVLLCSFLGALAALVTCFIGTKKGFEVYDFMLYAMVFGFAVCALSSICLVTLGRRIGAEVMTTLVVPLLCGCVVGLLILLISSLMTPHLGNLVCLILCVVFGFIIYIFLLGLTRNIHENEISIMYGEIGKRIVGLIFR